MESTRPFEPIASRDLVLVRPDSFEMPIHVAISAPYKPATMQGIESFAGCLVLTCDDPDLATEVCGSDEMDALAVALSFLELYLIKIVEETQGTLRHPDGSSVDPLGSIFLKRSRAFVDKKTGRP